MPVYFRRGHRRLFVSLGESRRVPGKPHPCSVHIAELGSIRQPMDVAGRVAFWGALHARLARLANRITPAQQAEIMGRVHDRIPIPEIEEMQTLQRARAEQAVQGWTEAESFNTGMAESLDEMAARGRHLSETSAESAASFKAEAERARAEASEAKAELAKLDAGEDVALACHTPPTRKQIDDALKAGGLSSADIRHMDAMGRLHDQLRDRGLTEIYWEELRRSLTPAQHRHERHMARELLKLNDFFAALEADGVDLTDVLKKLDEVELSGVGHHLGSPG